MNAHATFPEFNIGTVDAVASLPVLSTFSVLSPRLCQPFLQASGSQLSAATKQRSGYGSAAPGKQATKARDGWTPVAGRRSTVGRDRGLHFLLGK